MATYSNRIRELRTARGMSQEKLADILGVTKQAVILRFFFEINHAK